MCIFYVLFWKHSLSWFTFRRIIYVYYFLHRASCSSLLFSQTDIIHINKTFSRCKYVNEKGHYFSFVINIIQYFVVFLLNKSHLLFSTPSSLTSSPQNINQGREEDEGKKTESPLTSSFYYETPPQTKNQTHKEYYRFMESVYCVFWLRTAYLFFIVPHKI